MSGQFQDLRVDDAMDPSRSESLSIADLPLPTNKIQLGKLSLPSRNKLNEGLGVVNGVDGALYLVSNREKSFTGVVQSADQLYRGAKDASQLLGQERLTNLLGRFSTTIGTAFSALGLVNFSSWGSVQGTARNLNGSLQVGQEVAKQATKAVPTALNTATQVAGGALGGVGAYYSVKELINLFGNGTMNGINMLRAGAGAFGAVAGIGAAASATASLLGGSSFLTGLSSTLALSGWGAPIAGAIVATTALVMALRSRKINQTNKVDDSILTELQKNGIENLGNEKYRTDKKWSEVFKVTDEFAKLLPTVRDEQGRPFKTANGQPYTMETFKNAPAEVRMKIRSAVGKAIIDKIDAGGLDNPGAGEKDKQANRDRMFMVAATMMNSTRDTTEIFDKAIKQAPAEQKQALFNQYVEIVTKSSQGIIGDPRGTNEQGKMTTGFMKREESTKTQWDWMQIELAKKADEFGVQFAANWATPPVDQKKYKDLKKRSDKKGFDKLEGGDKLNLMKYELAQKSRGQP